MQTNKRLGFGLKTAYIAVVYLDRFFLHRIIDVRRNISSFSFVFSFNFCLLNVYFSCNYYFVFTREAKLGPCGC